MNRHQSNPFLSDWDAKDEIAAPIAGVFDNDQAEQVSDSCGEIMARRNSSSQANVSGNPFGAQRAADRRLYHRNMSSFEAASLQLEHQQQMQENGSKTLSGNQVDMIAKMTADFQSAIETNDKEFAVESGNLGEDCDPPALNPFDPFETIVDDDISIPSPAASSNQAQQADKFPNLEDDGSTNNTNGDDDIKRRPKDIDLADQRFKNTHDSIDDDEDELVSTPVRNIKSSSQKIVREPSADSGKSDSRLKNNECASTDNFNTSIKSDNGLGLKDQPSDDPKTAENTNSIEKASLFASLLASAESSGHQTETSTDNLETEENNMNQEAAANCNVEHATHVIKGTHSAGDGNIDRPVSYFDPFETVIDKDALTSLMNDSNQPSTHVSKSTADELDTDYALPTRTPEPTPIHQIHKNQEEKNSLGPNQGRSLKTSQIADSTSIETVIENEASQTGEQESKTSMNIDTKETSECKGDVNKEDHSESTKIIPRPTRSNQTFEQQQAPTFQDSSKVTPAKRANKQKKKSSFHDESSDSSDDDDRIQIVIKARDTSKADSTSKPALVPLLPPPPSKSSMKQARERGQVEDMPSPVMSYKTKHESRVSDTQQEQSDSSEDFSRDGKLEKVSNNEIEADKVSYRKSVDGDEDQEDSEENGGQFVIPMTHSDEEGDAYAQPDTPLYDEDTSYVLEDFPEKYEGPGWEMMLRYPPKKKLTSNRFWKKIFVKLSQVPLIPDSKSSKKQQESNEPPQTCIALQVYDKPEDKKPMQEIPIQATYTVSEISSQQFDQFGKIFTIKLQYIFYKERVGVRQGQLARFIHTGHIGSSTTSGGHGVDPLSIGAIKRMGAPIEHSPQISQIIKLGCTSYDDIKRFKNCLEDYLFKMPIHRDRALSIYKTEEVQMAVRDETYLELSQVGTVTKQLARVRLFFLSFLNGMPTVEVGINDIHRQGKEIVGRMDILPVVTEEWIRLEAWQLHSTVDKEKFEDPESRIINLIPPDATFFELMRFRIRPPRNRELPLQISANMSVTRTKVSINCDIMVPGCVSRKHGQIPCEGIAIKIHIPECWIYFFREEKHFRMGSKKSVNRRAGKVKGIERFLGGGGLQDINDESSLIEVTSGQAKYEHHHHAIVWRAARWPKENQSAYVQNTMKIRLPLTAYDKMPDSFYEYVHVEYTMPATTVSHTTLRSISVNPCDDEPPEKYVKYSAKYEYKVKMRLSVNLGAKLGEAQPEASPIIIMKQPDVQGDLQREEDSDDDESGSDVGEGASAQNEETR